MNSITVHVVLMHICNTLVRGTTAAHYIAIAKSSNKLSVMNSSCIEWLLDLIMYLRSFKYMYITL